MKREKIEVCNGESGRYFLRLHLSAKDGGLVRFQSGDEFTKYEADSRAIAISSLYGFGRDELPTQPAIAPYPNWHHVIKEEPISDAKGD